MDVVRDIVQQNEEREKKIQKDGHDRKAVIRKFEVNDFVLVFKPTKRNKLLNEWHGPFIIMKKITEVTYQVYTGTSGKHLKTFHTNVMKSWASPAHAVFLAEDLEVDDLFDLNKQTKSHAKHSTHTFEGRLQGCHPGHTWEDVSGAS